MRYSAIKFIPNEKTRALSSFSLKLRSQVINEALSSLNLSGPCPLSPRAEQLPHRFTLQEAAKLLGLSLRQIQRKLPMLMLSGHIRKLEDKRGRAALYELCASDSDIFAQYQ